ncbi:MAG TPA: DNA gyrase inhibitor YacG [Isosphaeraceae bacterium]|nr:DNA gyrase inhibitor YacG [Isosphaeraceae bacterium]
MIQGRCPICSRRLEIAARNDLPSFPFCSKRCRLIDLGRWADGTYVIPGAPPPEKPEVSPGEPDDST